MRCWLSARTHLATVGPDLVVLDVRANAYFCLPNAAAAIHIQGDAITLSDPGLLASFQDEGFVAKRAAPRRPDPPPPRPIRDLGQAVAEAVRPGDVVAMLGAAWTMIGHYHLRSFDHLLDHAAWGRKATLQSEPQSLELARIVAVFDRLLPWVPFQGVCLYRSFMLLNVLRARGFGARWVFGVHTWPFQAHCWLQVGDTVLDDTADRVAAFEPILAI